MFYKTEKNLSHNSYYDKSLKESTKSSEVELQKKEFNISRQQVWKPKNTRPDKLRDQIKILEQCFQLHYVAHFDTTNNKIIKVSL